jgi:hypothetical protein
MENTKITRVVVMDFDGTLMDTMTPDIGKDLWKRTTGFEWPHKGWWGREESLDTTVFGCNPIDKVRAAYDKEVLRQDTLLVMMTGRIPRLKPHVENMLNQHNLSFDEYHYCNHHSTIEFKLNKLNEFVRDYPELEVIEIWEDRPEHTKVFQEWCESAPIEGIVHQV